MEQEAPIANRIAVAFGVGWHIAELYHYERIPGERERKHSDSLPGIGSLEPAKRAHLLTLQVTSGLGQLGQETLAQDGRAHIDAELADESIDADVLQRAVLDTHTLLLMALTATDAALGSAYGLGRALAETMLVPTTDQPTSFTPIFESYRIRTMQDWLVNLEGQFPPYAAAAVRLTLNQWSRWASDLSQKSSTIPWTAEQKRRLGQCVRRQGEMWYGLLTGAIEPTHLLGPDDYVKAAESLVRRVGGLAGHFLVGTWIGRALILLIVALGALLWWVLATSHLNAIAGTTALLLGALGVTTGSVVTAVGKVLQQAQSPLWAAELIQGIATAATVLPK